MCGHGGHHGDHSCCCGEGDRGRGMRCHTGRGFRRHLTREERITRLEAYLKDLQAEAKAVEERLAEMRAGS